MLEGSSGRHTASSKGNVKQRTPGQQGEDAQTASSTGKGKADGGEVAGHKQRPKQDDLRARSEKGPTQQSHTSMIECPPDDILVPFVKQELGEHSGVTPKSARRFWDWIMAIHAAEMQEYGTDKDGESQYDAADEGTCAKGDPCETF